MSKFVHREQPLQQLVRILKCEDGSKSFFVVTGEWHQNRRFLVYVCLWRGGRPNLSTQGPSRLGRARSHKSPALDCRLGAYIHYV